MSVIPIGYAEVSHRYALIGDAEPMFTVYGVETVGVPDMNSLAEDIHLAAGTALADLLSSSYTVEETTAKTAIAAGASSSGPIGGVAGIDAAPQNVASLHKKVTGARGRENQGRIYLPGPDRDSITDVGTLTSGELGRLQTGMSDFLTALEGVTDVVAMVVLHSSAGPAPTTVNNLLTDPRVATQRRRLR